MKHVPLHVENKRRSLNMKLKTEQVCAPKGSLIYSPIHSVMSSKMISRTQSVMLSICIIRIALWDFYLKAGCKLYVDTTFSIQWKYLRALQIAKKKKKIQ